MPSGHAQNTREPTALELDLIKEFQQTDPAIFLLRGASSVRERRSAAATSGRNHGMRTARARDVRQRAFRRRHDKGPLQHLSLGTDAQPVRPWDSFGLPPGGRRASIGVSERNLMGNPVYTFLVREPDGGTFTITTPDPGAMLNDSATERAPGVPTPPRSFFANFFKIPALWGVKDTARYLHDNSAKTLEDVAKFYALFFLDSPSTRGFVFTEQDQADMVAFLKLLR